MSSLLALLKNAVLSRHEDAQAAHMRSAALAQAQPSETDVQAVAAYNAWVARDNHAALTFALRADSGPISHFHALLVLTAVHAEGEDKAATYRYAKRLVEFQQPGRVIHAIARPTATLLAVIKRRSNPIDELAQSYQEWLHWSQQFVAEYEHANVDA